MKHQDKTKEQLINELQASEDRYQLLFNMTPLAYQALIEKAPDGIALIGSDGNFKYISPSAKRIFGYSQSDENYGHPDEYTHPDDMPMVASELAKIFSDPTYIPTLQYRFIDKQGHWHWIETTFSNLLAHPGVEAIVLNFRDITERKLQEDTQAFLLQISNPGTTENFFQSLAKYLSQCLEMEYVCIDILEGDGLTAKTLAIYNDGNFDPNVSYALKDTPCGEVVGNHICCYPKAVRNLFPNDPALGDIKAESYIGTTLRNFEGKPIGLIAVIGQKPLHNDELAKSLLKLVSLRAAGQLETILAEEKVKESEAIFIDIVEKNPMSIQILDMDGYVIQLNPAHTKLFGAEPPSDYSVLKDPQLLNAGFDKLFDRIKSGEAVYFPDSYYNVHDVDPSFPDSPTWVKALGFTLKDSNGNPNKIVLMHENITERKNAEALLNDIIENNPMSIQVVDLEGHTVRCNPAFIQLFGTVPPPDFSIFDDLASKNPELENIVLRVKNGEIAHLPDIYFNAHDSLEEAPDIPLWIRALIFPLNSNSGKTERFVFMHENITERKKAEQELIAAKEQAQESDRLKSAFLTNMSHEIRTPMNGILGFSELLKEPGLTGEKQQEYIRIIEKGGARLLNIINDIIDISKIEAGLMSVKLAETDINEKMEFINTFFQPEVEEKGMQLLLKNTLRQRRVTILTDGEKVYSILTNLVKNAIKYSYKGFIELGCNLKAVKGSAVLEFYVKDTGIGVPKNRQSAIFERFIQADNAGKLAYQGAGLGLAISKAYVEMLGGKIWVESEEGIGSTFYFTLPCDTVSEEKNSTERIAQSQDEMNPENKK